MQLSLATLPHRLYRWLGVDRRRAARDQTVTLDRRRVFILPTRHGLVFAALTFLMLVGAANYNNSVAFLLTFLLMGLGLVGLLQTYRNLAGMTLRPGSCDPVFCGDPARYELVIDDAARTERCALTVEIAGQPPTWFDVERGGARIGIGVATSQRGFRPLGRVTIATRFPLGLFRACAYLNFDQTCLVYPHPADSFVPAPQRAPAGRWRTGPRPGNDDFLGHRDYLRGDPPRHVDWKAAARGGRLLSKTFGEEEHAECWLDWDDYEGMATETRLSLLCRGVLNAEAGGLRYGLRLPGIRLEPARGEGHRHLCLRALALHGSAT